MKQQQDESNNKSTKVTTNLQKQRQICKSNYKSTKETTNLQKQLQICDSNEFTASCFDDISPFFKTQEEFESYIFRIVKSFKKLLKLGGSAAKHYDKFISIFGYNENGEKVDVDPKMEPLFFKNAQRHSNNYKSCGKFPPLRE